VSDYYNDFKKSLFKEKHIRDKQKKKKEKREGPVPKKKPKDLGKAIADSPLFRK
jgi:hypothetical protein